MNKAGGKCATPYSSGLALPLVANYNDAAHSGGQGVRSSQRTTSTGGEARNSLGTPGLVYFWVTYWRPLALDPGLKPQSADHLRQGDTVGQGSGNVPADVRRRQIRKAD